MEHLMTVYENGIKNLSAIETYDGTCIIKVASVCNETFEQVEINKEQLHSFIGTLLHVQQKLKGGK
jgi:hypothetical protein